MKYQILVLSIVLFTACGGGQESTQEENAAPQSMVQAEETPGTEATAVVNEAGKKVYDQYCLVCHQANGQGVPSAFPPLTQTEYVNGDTERLIGIVLNGLTGEIEVNGEVYNGVMVAHNFLSDQEIADVLTYVRSNFGNSSPAITAEEVAAVRGG